MKRILLYLSCLMGLTVLAACSSNSGSTASTVTSSACTYTNGYYYYNGVPYATCPVTAATTTTGTCTYLNGAYYYNGVAYATCPTSTATTHNCANQTLRDANGQTGLCSVQYNYCAGYTMYYPGTYQAIYCQ